MRRSGIKKIYTQHSNSEDLIIRVVLIEKYKQDPIIDLCCYVNDIPIYFDSLHNKSFKEKVLLKHNKLNNDVYIIVGFFPELIKTDSLILNKIAITIQKFYFMNKNML